MRVFAGLLTGLAVVVLAACGSGSRSATPTTPPPPPPPPPLPRPPAMEIESCGPYSTHIHFTAVPDGYFYEFERRYGETGSWHFLTRLDGRLLDRHDTGRSGPVYLFEDFEPYRRNITSATYYRVRAEVSDGRKTDWSDIWYCEPVEPTVTTDSRFNLRFWGEIAFDAHECPTSASCPNYYVSGRDIEPLEGRVLYVLDTTSPNFHIRTTGFTSSEVSVMRRTIPEAMEALTGESFSGRITTGSEGSEREGWILVRTWDDPGDGPPGSEECGTARLGSTAGLIRINKALSNVSGSRGCATQAIFVHEFGHALGFFHVASTAHVMQNPIDNSRRSFSSSEQYHAQLAYALGQGTRYSDGPQATTTVVKPRSSITTRETTAPPAHRPEAICRFN